MKHLDIGEVSQRARISASALRFYEEKGLIRSSGRRGLRRLFDPNVLQRLALIALGRAAGLSLDDMARMFGPDGQLRVDRQMLATKADELQQTIKKLGAMQKGLQHAAACRAPSHMECPTFRRLLSAAERGLFAEPSVSRKSAPKPARTSKTTSEKRSVSAAQRARRASRRA